MRRLLVFLTYAVVTSYCASAHLALADCLGGTALSAEVAPPTANRVVSEQAVERTSNNGAETLTDLLQNSVLGDVDAMNRLGIRYAHGLGVKRNYLAALKWFRLSAIRGHLPAMVNLATMYQIGAGGHRDYRRAYAWLLVATALGTPGQIHDAAIFKLGMIASSIRPTTAARAQHLAHDIAGTLGRRCDMPTHRYLGWEFTPSG